MPCQQPVGSSGLGKVRGNGGLGSGVLMNENLRKRLVHPKIEKSVFTHSHVYPNAVNNVMEDEVRNFE